MMAAQSPGSAGQRRASEAEAVRSREEFLQMRQRSLSTPNTPKIAPEAPLMASASAGGLDPYRDVKNIPINFGKII